MALTRANFGELLKPGQKKVFFDSYNQAAPQYTNVYTLENSDKKEEKVARLGGFGLWGANDEGAEIQQDNMVQGQTVTFTNKRFDKGYEITWEMVQDDQYGIWKGNAGNGGNAKMLGRSLKATIETEAAKILDGGFTNVGYDGVALFAANHPYATTGTASNRITGTLNFNNIKAACILMRKQKDESASATIAAVPKNLIVPGDLEFIARTQSVQWPCPAPGSESLEYLPNMNIIVLDYLTNTQQWFVQAEDVQNLTFFWREQPVFGAQPVAKKMDWFYYGYARWSCGYVDWRGIVGATGA